MILVLFSLVFRFCFVFLQFYFISFIRVHPLASLLSMYKVYKLQIVYMCVSVCMYIFIYSPHCLLKTIFTVLLFIIHNKIFSAFVSLRQTWPNIPSMYMHYAACRFIKMCLPLPSFTLQFHPFMRLAQLHSS